MRNREIDNNQDILDSRDVIARIEELEADLESRKAELEEARDCWLYHHNSQAPETCEDVSKYPEGAAWVYCKAYLEMFWSDGDSQELKSLQRLADEAGDSPDWNHGELLIREDYFTDYIEELINDCYEMPKEMNSGAWPYRHITIDFEAAAEEAKQDYMEVDFDGVTYFIRA